MKECDVSESNNTTAEVSLMRNIPITTSGASCAFFHSNMIYSPTGVVLLGSNKNRVGSMGRNRCTCNWWVDAWA
jgi:hypothetical protein